MLWNKTEDSTFIKQLTFPDYFKNDKKKRGIMSTPYRQVKLHYENDLKMTETEMIKKFLKWNLRCHDSKIQ